VKLKKSFVVLRAFWVFVFWGETNVRKSPIETGIKKAQNNCRRVSSQNLIQKYWKEYK
jgi:hypothetical protein